MEELPVIFALWQHKPSEILDCDSIHKPHLQKPEGLYDSRGAYIFNDPLSQWNSISPFGSKYVAVPWQKLLSIRLLSRVKTPLFGFKALSDGYFKRDKEEFKNIHYTV